MPKVLRLSVEDSFGIKGDMHGVADDNASTIESRIPAHAKVMPVNDCFGREARASFRPFVHAVFPPGSLPLAQVMNV